MKVKLLRSCVLGPGKTGKAGEEVEVSTADGRYLIGINKATEDLKTKVEPKKAAEK